MSRLRRWSKPVKRPKKVAGYTKKQLGTKSIERPRYRSPRKWPPNRQPSSRRKKIAANTKKQSTIKAKLKAEKAAVNTVKMEQPNKVKQPTVGQPEASEMEASHIKQSLPEPLQKITKMDAANVRLLLGHLFFGCLTVLLSRLRLLG